MDNDLFNATEILNSAYKEALNNERVNNRKWGFRGQVKRLKEAIEQRNLTVSEKLLLCYGPKEELFSSRSGDKRAEQEAHNKGKGVQEELARLFDELHNLPKSEQDRIRKELGIEKGSITEVVKPSENNTTDAFEHSNSKDSKNGK